MELCNGVLSSVGTTFSNGSAADSLDGVDDGVIQTMTLGHIDLTDNGPMFGNEGAYNDGIVVGRIWGFANLASITIWAAPAVGTAAAGSGAPQMLVIGGEGTAVLATPVSGIGSIAGLLGLALFSTGQNGGQHPNYDKLVALQQKIAQARNDVNEVQKMIDAATDDLQRDNLQQLLKQAETILKDLEIEFADLL